MLGIAVRDGALNVTVPRDSADTLCRPVTKLWRGVVFTLRPGHWRWINPEWPLQIKVLAINPTILIIIITHSLCTWSVIQNESLSNKFSTFKYVLCIPYYFLSTSHWENGKLSDRLNLSRIQESYSEIPGIPVLSFHYHLRWYQHIANITSASSTCYSERIEILCEHCRQVDCCLQYKITILPTFPS